LSLTPESVSATLQKAGLEKVLPPSQIPPLLTFIQRLLSINEALNLTKWIQDEEVLIHHLLDSAHAIPFLKTSLKREHRWLDLGTGCGFPGALFVAAFPEVETTFLDSVAKKIKALEGCFQGLGWATRTWVGRAEDLGRDPKTRETWDGVLCRAVADLPVVLEYGLPLLRPGGYLVNWMTEEQMGSVDKSKEALRILSGCVVQKQEYSLPGLSHKRTILFVEKMGKTPSAYPRPVGKPSRSPL
jgi:16S rRNA (guanine527-N7)-methyltransferase